MSTDSLSENEKEAVNYIKSVDKAYQGQLWKALDVTSRTGSRISKRLEEKDVITREPTTHNGNNTYRLILADEYRDEEDIEEDKDKDGTASHKLGPEEKRVLRLVESKGEIPQSELSKKINVSARRGSRIASGLEDKGLIEREEGVYEGNRTYILLPREESDNITVQESHQGVGINDQKSTEDNLNFSPYVSSVVEFLTHDRTEPPLNISIEGKWGSGKSSFMGQMKRRIEEDESKKYYTVSFNPWRHEKEDSLWAAFMLQVFHQIKEQSSLMEKISGDIKMFIYRFESEKFVTKLLRRLLIILPVIVGIWVILLMMNLPGTSPTNISIGVAIASLIASIIWTWKNAMGPIEKELRKYIANPEYEGRVSFVERIHDDFEKFLNAYVDEDAEVFVFIDDLDRCLPEKAAELVKSTNMMISNGDPRVFFIMRMDREKVAAGIASEHEELIKYLDEYKNPTFLSSNTESTSNLRASDEIGDRTHGTRFANNYLEKFIQIPFQVPKPTEEEVGILLESVLENQQPGKKSEDGRGQINSGREETEKTQEIHEIDPIQHDEIKNIGKEVSGILNYNPRKIKTFVNLFRLRAMLALDFELLGKNNGISPMQLGKFVAISLRWPSLAPIMSKEEKIDELYDYCGAREDPPGIIDDFSEGEKDALCDLLMWGVDEDAERYRMEPVPKEMFWISPRIEFPD